jgi:hypothetical protein
MGPAREDVALRESSSSPLGRSRSLMRAWHVPKSRAGVGVNKASSYERIWAVVRRIYEAKSQLMGKSRASQDLEARRARGLRTALYPRKATSCPGIA